MEVAEELRFPKEIAVYYESGDYIIHNYKLNSWIVLDEKEYEIAKFLIYDHKKPSEIITKNNKSLVKKVLAQISMFKIGYYGSEPVEYKLLREIESKGMPKIPPKAVYFVTTYKCNLNCIYCYADSSPKRSMKGDLTTAEAKDMLYQVKNLGAETIIFTGGEAFLRKDLFELMKYSKEIGLKVNVITNGVLISSKEKAEIVASLCDLVTISLDSMDKKQHELNRGSGTWEKVIRAINYLYEAGCKMKINQTITKNNTDSIDELINFAKNKSIKLNITPIAQIGRGDEKTQGLNNFERKNVHDKILNQEIDDIEADGCKTINVRQFEHNRQCGHGTSEFSIDSRGNVFPCKLLHNPFFLAGSIRETSLYKIWNESPVFNDSRDRTVHQLEGCRKCTFKESCGGGCRAFHWGATGDINRTTDIDCSSIRRSIRKKNVGIF